MVVKKVVLASPRGFCAGVKRAIDIVEKSIKDNNGNGNLNNIYIKHQIVHNKHVTQRFEKKGVITKNYIDEIPEGAIAIFSAHGSMPEEFSKAKERNINIIDAVCPLVEKVHVLARKLVSQGYKIIYIGKKGHVEANGVIAEAPDSIVIIENSNDVDALEFSEEDKLATLTQTTLNVNKTKKIMTKLRDKFPDIKTEKKEDICYATTNRQIVVEKVAKQVDVMIIVGSKNSSNTNRLYNIAKLNCYDAYMVDDVNELDDSWFDNPKVETVGISSGASVPEDLVQDIVKYFKSSGANITEDVCFEEKVLF